MATSIEFTDIELWYDMNEIKHHGILGMKWGIRRFQNKDGSLTSAGRARQEKKHHALVINDTFPTVLQMIT